MLERVGGDAAALGHLRGRRRGAKLTACCALAALRSVEPRLGGTVAAKLGGRTAQLAPSAVAPSDGRLFDGGVGRERKRNSRLMSIEK